MVLALSAVVTAAVYWHLCSYRHVERTVLQERCVVSLVEGHMGPCDLWVLLKVVLAVSVWSQAHALESDALELGGEVRESVQC